MKSFAISMLIVLSLVVLFIIGISLNNSNNGIVILEGYEHGVVICGEEITINQGHENDPQVQELIQLAEVECSKHK